MKNIFQQIKKKNLLNKKLARSFVARKQPKLPIYERIRVKGFKIKDRILIGCLISSAITSIYYEYHSYSEQNLISTANKLDSTNESVLIEGLNEGIFSLIDTDHGALLIEFGILDKILNLLSHQEIEIRRRAVKKKKRKNFYLVVIFFVIRVNSGK
jgi:hypothetical protein